MVSPLVLVSSKMLHYPNTWVHRYRDERLPKGPRFASESLDADTREWVSFV